MTKKISQNDPQRPRNVRKRSQREAKKEHRRIMQQKRETELKDKENVSSPYGGDKRGASSPSTGGQRGSSLPPKQGGLGGSKVFHADHVRDVKNYINRLKQRITLPFEIQALRKGEISKVVIINREGKERELLPDRPGVYKILCHAKVAKVITSQMCIISKITQHERITDSVRKWIDGSWSIAPCSPAMLNGTTVQHVRRRPFFFLRRYWYEISFDGRVQPASLFYDYDINPLTTRQTLYITHEFVKVRHSDAENDYFRFWRYKHNIT